MRHLRLTSETRCVVLAQFVDRRNEGDCSLNSGFL